MGYLSNKAKCFEVARSVSELSDRKKQKTGCAIFYKRKLIAVGSNTNRETYLQKKYNIYRNFDTKTNKNCAHAEMVALERFLKLTTHQEIDCSKIEIFIYRQHANGTLALSKPCPACEAALRDYGVKHIYYTGENSFVYEKYE